jgi:hypothetical protein
MKRPGQLANVRRRLRLGCRTPPWRLATAFANSALQFAEVRLNERVRRSLRVVRARWGFWNLDWRHLYIRTKLLKIWSVCPNRR